jgi:proteasome lid subunit RPN8/RPN11
MLIGYRPLKKAHLPTACRRQAVRIAALDRARRSSPAWTRHSRALRIRAKRSSLVQNGALFDWPENRFFNTPVRSVLKLRKTTIRDLAKHAEEAFPEECCGVVLEGGNTEEVHEITNIQARLHREEPDRYPREATLAYFMDPKELASILDWTDSRGMKIKVIYHSHPDHEAYFSEEDRERAMAWGEPSYPEATYLVLSVGGRVFKEAKAFHWDESARDFVEVSWCEESESPDRLRNHR